MGVSFARCSTSIVSTSKSKSRTDSDKGKLFGGSGSG